MVNQTLNDIEMDLLSKRRKTGGSLTECQVDLARREKEQAHAETALQSAKTLVKSKETMLSEAVLELRSCEEGLPIAQEELNRRDTLIGEKVMEIEQAQEALGSMEADNPCEEAIRTMLRELSFPLDRLDDWSQVKSELSDRITMLKGVVSQAGKSRKELAAKVKASQIGVDVAREKQQTSQAALKEGQSECDKCATTLKDAVDKHSQQKKITTQIAKAYRSAQECVSHFQEGALAAFKEIARDIEQRHEVSFLVVNAPAQEETLPSSNLQLEPCEKKEAIDKSKLEASGTPVIDRSKRDAVLRRRSAVLPAWGFSRKSLMSRRASLARASLSQETKSFKSCGSESDAGDVTMESEQNNDDVEKDCTDEAVVIKASGAIVLEGGAKDMEVKEECNAIEGLGEVPTPNRNSFGSATNEDAIAA
jgi:chromosome segregation ATPase